MIRFLRPGDPPDAFPPLEQALDEPDGLLCAGGDLSPARLLEAYRRGIFPWYSVGQPILWWSPNPRAVLFPGEFRVSRSLAKTLRNRGCETRLDSAFAEVVVRCADTELRPEGTWISPDMQSAYLELHRLGHAHSVETWQAGRLVGGLYGVALGRVFFGESMFSIERDASKVALARLVEEAMARGIELIDCQVTSPHLESLGARSIPRARFSALLSAAIPHAGTHPAWD
ncbi:MAG: leucyl/phenylalanyl-tRNA--protein transferase [Steroidobacteraceae bacterium]|nr:leucyl/phenylalanyl-tRNA--protein transferase [Steroidobacteraceae bacterium]